jgi:phage tail-like protein
VLKRGIIVNDDKLFEWFAQCSGEGLAGKKYVVPRAGGEVTLLDFKGAKTVRKWTFVDAFPVKWTGPRLSASGRELAVEELEVCHLGFKSGK